MPLVSIKTCLTNVVLNYVADKIIFNLSTYTTSHKVVHIRIII